MTKEEYIKQLKDYHDFIKEHPYWMIFDHAMFRNEICKTFREMISLIYAMKYDAYKEENDNPFFCIIDVLTHNFNAMLSYLYHTKVLDEEDTKNLQQFYIPTMQCMLTLVHMFIEGIADEPENMIGILPNDVYHPKNFRKYIPYYKDSWTDTEGYNFMLGNKHWRPLAIISRDKKEKLLKEIQSHIDKCKLPQQNLLCNYFQAEMRDAANETNFVYLFR